MQVQITMDLIMVVDSMEEAHDWLYEVMHYSLKHEDLSSFDIKEVTHE